MQRLGNDGVAHKAAFVEVFAGLIMLAAAHTASAQSPAPSGTNVETAPSEAARRAAMSPYRFILQNASAPARKAAPAPAPAAPSSPPVEARRAAPAPVQQASVQPSVAAPPAAAPVSTPAAAPEAAIASLSRQVAEPPPAPPRLEIIPVRTDEPRLSPALLREQPHGTVKVHFDINTDGSVGEVKVVSSDNRSLNKPTMEAVHGWKFQPVDAVLTVETEIVYKMDN